MKDRPDLPTGTVTFLFSDIAGSTRLLRALGDRYPEVLETHQRLLRQAFATNGGTVLGTEGDSFFAVFPAAPGALRAAIQAQRALTNQPWPEGSPVRVRMGLHTGQATVSGDNYIGMDVHRAARIVAAGHGGQVLISDSTRTLVEHTLPEKVRLLDLGDHRLRDLEHPERLYQVVIEGLPSEFPPIRSAQRHLGNLPEPLTSFVGRERALQEVKGLLTHAKLVTLTGPGGTGKTSLALRAAADLQPTTDDGAFLVRLASISDPDLVMPAVAQALGATEDTGRSPTEMVIEHLKAGDVLLVLDNFEQVLPAATQVGELLDATARVRVLATSREPLALRRERQYQVPPMEVPDLARLPAPERLAEYEAVSLFVERASAVRPGFEVTKENGPAIAEICARLDGLPLAIELAAATTKLLSPQAILDRLERHLPLLSGGSRDVPARQRTLRDAIAWSYDLLDAHEPVLFSRLSVFSGGFTLEAAESVCDGELGDTFEVLASLVNKSLVRQVETSGPEPRFTMLETIREYAADRLAERGEADRLERRHAEHFLAFAEAAEAHLTGPRQATFLDKLGADHDNLRSAIERAAANGWVDEALRLAAALWRFWQVRGHLREGKERLQRVLALPDADHYPEARARALSAAGSVAYWMGDFPAAGEAYQQALDLSRQIGNPGAIAEGLYNLAYAANFLDEDERARGLMREAATIFRQVGDRAGEAKVLWSLSGMFVEDDEEAMTLAVEALRIFRGLGDRFHEGWALWTLGNRGRHLGRFDEARARLAEGLAIFRDAGDVSGMLAMVGGFTDLAVAEGDAARALRLAAAAAASRTSTETGISEWLGASEERRQLAETRADDAEAARLWAEGQAMSLQEAVAYALGGDPVGAKDTARANSRRT